MAKREKPPDPPPPSAPLYMVSFGDMISIMLTFFILLCSYATERKAGFVSDGIGSFRVSLNALGLPGILPGDVYPVDLGASRVRYRPSQALNSQLLTDPDGDMSDMNRDALRQVVKNALNEDEVTRIPMELIFDRRAVTLSAEHMQALDTIAPLLAGKSIDVRIEAYAYEEAATSRATREIAVRRAMAVARHLTDTHGIDAARIATLGYGSGGAGVDNRENRVVQDRLGRRIGLVYLIPKEK